MDLPPPPLEDGVPMQLDPTGSMREQGASASSLLLEQALASTEPEAIPLLPLDKALQILDAAEQITARTATTTTTSTDRPTPISEMVDAAMPWIPELMGSVVQSRARAFAGVQPKRKKDREMRKLMMAKLAGNGGAGAREVLASIAEQEGDAGEEGEGEGDGDEEGLEEQGPAAPAPAPMPVPVPEAHLPGIRLSLRLPAGVVGEGGA